MGVKTVSFKTAGKHRFVVPEAVHKLHVEAWGAQGGGLGGAEAGRGGYAKGILGVQPGDELEIRVGGGGLYATTNGGIRGGFNGGGRARLFGNNGIGSGGGATDVRPKGEGLHRRLIVAAGGGGANDFGVQVDGGAGGGTRGVDGAGANPGKGATQTRGGAGDDGCPDGKFGIGGDGQATPSFFNCTGGGGGWFGGGAGETGGGGSSYIALLKQAVTASDRRQGSGYINIKYDVPVHKEPLSRHL